LCTLIFHFLCICNFCLHASATARGICWSASNQTPTTSDGNVANGSGLGSFTSSLGGLSPGTTYYLTAYATNSIGVAYSTASTFKTLALAPTITTADLSNIATTTASSGGTIPNDGGSPVIARGVCWSTNQNPSIADSKTSDGTGIGSFTSSMTNLIPGATYYFRAYATNSVGTTYGSQMTAVTKEENIVFEVSPYNGTASVDIKSDVVPFTIKVLSKIPPAGITYSVKMTQTDNIQVVYKLDTTTANNNVVMQLGKFGISKSYSIAIDATSKANKTNTASKTLTAKRNRVYKNYLRPSYELSNYDEWIDYKDIYKSPGVMAMPNTLFVAEACQLDYDGDGLEDIFSGDIDSMMHYAHPQILYRNLGGEYLKQNIKIPQIYAAKLLVGDFNNDSIPDVFALGAVDAPPGESFESYWQNCNLLLNDRNNMFQKKPMPNVKGFYYAGCSGDIDNDGDLDIIAFGGIRNFILWNDGKGNFTQEDYFGEVSIDYAELIDINNDGFLDLVISRVNHYTNQIHTIEVLWGNGKGFDATSCTKTGDITTGYAMDLDFVDIDNDKIYEILYASDSDKGWKLNLYKLDDKLKTLTDVTQKYIPENIRKSNDDIAKYFRVQDIDKNGKMDIFSTDKHSNIRWEHGSDGVFRRK
ncbi:MAG: FG-GAP-like repeat-containing protein, partial [Prolixibacteraceae bacterium]